MQYQQTCYILIIFLLSFIFSSFVNASPQEEDQQSLDSIYTPPASKTKFSYNGKTNIHTPFNGLMDNRKKTPKNTQDLDKPKSCLNTQLNIVLPNGQSTSFELPLCHNIQCCPFPFVPGIGQLHYQWQKTQEHKWLRTPKNKIVLYFYFKKFLTALSTSKQDPRLKCLPLITFAGESQQSCYICKNGEYYREKGTLHYQFELPDDLTNTNLQLSKALEYNIKVCNNPKDAAQRTPAFKDAEKTASNRKNKAANIHFASHATKIESLQELSFSFIPWQLFIQLSNKALYLAGLEIFQQHEYFKDFYVSLYRFDTNTNQEAEDQKETKHQIVMVFEPKQPLSPDHKDYNHFNTLKNSDRFGFFKPNSPLTIPPWGKSIVIDCDDFKENQSTSVNLKNCCRPSSKKLLASVLYPLKDAWDNGLKRSGCVWKPNVSSGFEFITSMCTINICKQIPSDVKRDGVQCANYLLNTLVKQDLKTETAETNDLIKQEQERRQKEQNEIKKQQNKKSVTATIAKAKHNSWHNSWKKKHRQKKKIRQRNKQTYWQEKGKDPEQIATESTETIINFCARKLQAAGSTCGNTAKMFSILTMMAQYTSATDADSATETDDFIAINHVNILKLIGHHDYFPKDGNYKLTGNIDASNFNSSIPEFKGTLDGQCFTISKLTCCLFEKITDGEVKNIHFNGADIDETSSYPALFANIIDGNSTVSNIGVSNSKLKVLETQSYDKIGVIATLITDSAQLRNVQIQDVKITSKYENKDIIRYVGLITGSLAENATMVNITAEGCSMEANNGTQNIGIGTGLASSRTKIDGITAMSCILSFDKDVEYGGMAIGATQMTGFSTVHHITAIDCELISDGSYSYLAIGSDYMKDINCTLSETTAIGCVLKGNGNMAAVAFGTITNEGMVTDTTAVRCKIEVREYYSDIGIGMVYGEGTKSGEIAIDCDLMTQQNIICGRRWHHSICNIDIMFRVSVNGTLLIDRNVDSNNMFCLEKVNSIYLNNDCSMDKASIDYFKENVNGNALCTPYNIPMPPCGNINMPTGTVDIPTGTILGISIGTATLVAATASAVFIGYRIYQHYHNKSNQPDVEEEGVNMMPIEPNDSEQ